MNDLKEFLSNNTQKVKDFWGKLGKAIKGMVIGVLALTVVVLIFIIATSGNVAYATLFSDMTEAEAAEVYAQLQEDGIDARVSNGTVQVPAANVEEIRLSMTALGYPQTGYNYDIYSSATGFGSTDADKELYETYQKQEDIMVTLRAMDKVKDAKVLISMAEESNFVLSNTTNSEASASVILELDDNVDRLTDEEADLIKSLVSRSVPSLSPENVELTDTKMNVYDEYTMSGSSGGGGYEEQLALTNTVRNQLEQQIIELFTPVFGKSNMSASVSVTLNFDKSVINSVQLEPVTEIGAEENIGIITSMKQLEERVIGEAEDDGGEPGTDENGIAPVYPEVDENAGNSVYYQITNEINAEVNEINQTLEESQGQIETISCTLLINGGEELAGIEEEVATQITTAIGVPIEFVTVAVREFSAPIEETAVDPGSEIGFLGIPVSAQPILFIALGLVLLLIIIVILVMKSSKKKQKQMQEQHQAFIEEQERLREEEELARIEQEQRDALFAEPQNDTLAQLHDIVSDNTASIAQLLRNWISDDLRR